MSHIILKKSKKGVSLVEALLSTAIFSFVSIMLFNITSDFFKNMRLADSSQTINQKFIQAYQYLNKDLRITDARYVYSYRTESAKAKSRWMIFPIPIDDNGVCSSTSNRICYSKVVIYYMYCTDSSCQECITRSSNDTEPYRTCSKKNLIRLVYNYAGSDDPNIFSLSLGLFAKDIETYLTPYKSKDLPDKKTYTIPESGEQTSFIYSSSHIAARDILDFTCETYNDPDDVSSSGENAQTATNIKSDAIRINIFAARTDESGKAGNNSQVDNNNKEVKSKDSITILIYPRNGQSRSRQSVGAILTPEYE